ncbi:MAG: GNAT family N-acetyltransferase [Bacteroidales bacterium]
MQEIIAPVPRNLLKKELTKERFLRNTNYGERQVYIITAHDSPHSMQEIGRLREFTFREAGGGRGESVDIDEFDTMNNPYKQLLVWDPKDEQIVGGYRFLEGPQVQITANGMPLLSTTEIFSFSDRFLKDYLPKTIELGRSFIQPSYQSSRKGIFSLDNLWDGLGGLVNLYPKNEYFFGKVTMYTSFQKEARDTLLYFVKKYHQDHDLLIVPIEPLKLITPEEKLEKLFQGLSLEDAFKVAIKRIRELGENIPPLFSSYLKLSPTMKSFGTAINNHFGNVEETGILIKIDEIYHSKKERHISQNRK